MKRIFLSIILILLFVSTLSVAHAQSLSSGITVSPSLIDLDLANDQPQKTISYTNNTDQEVTLSFSASDISSLQVGYKLGKNKQNAPSTWITFDKAELALLPKESGTITVSILPDQLLPGTNYASLQATVEGGTAGKNITVNQVLSTLLFVRTNTGKEVEKGDVANMQLVQSGLNFPNQMIYQFANTGTVGLTPYGTLRITDPLGRLIDKIVLNQDSLRTLPDSQRDYQQLISKPERFLYPGRYAATLSVQYGKRPEVLVADYSFYSFGSFNPLIIGGITIILLTGSLIAIRIKRRLLVR